MLLAETFRMGGHASHDDAEARATFPDATFKAWGARDPIGLYEEYLEGAGRTARELEDVESDTTAQMERAAAEALGSKQRVPAGTSALNGVYAEE